VTNADTQKVSKTKDGIFVHTYLILVQKMVMVSNKSISHRKSGKSQLVCRCLRFAFVVLVGCLIGAEIGVLTKSSSFKSEFVENKQPSYDTYKIAYGTRGGGEQTAQLVRDAILEGFRAIVTGGHHVTHNETGVGEGWKAAMAVDSSIKRTDLFLQTMFVPWDGNDFVAQPKDPAGFQSLEDQVRCSIEQSLENLQTTYIDAVLFHNFRAKMHPYDEIIKAWRVLEEFQQKGTIRFLGLTNIHNADFLKQLHQDSKVKPVIVQNRFHANRGFDVSLQETFDELKIHVQRFWILTGNGSGNNNKDLAIEKNLTPEQLMLAFVMSLGHTTALVGTHSKQHMMDDLEVSKRYDKDIFTEMFTTDQDRIQFAKNIGMKYETRPIVRLSS